MADGNVQDFFVRVADSKMADGIGWRVAPGFTVFELKDHCVRKHEGILDKCVVNYTLASKHIEIDIKKKWRKIYNM